jgi:hypothetical protein
MCQSARYDRCIGYVSVNVHVLALFSNSGFPGFGCPGVIFLFIEVSTSLTKYLCSLNSAFTIFCYTLCTHTEQIRSHSIFQLATHNSDENHPYKKITKKN